MRKFAYVVSHTFDLAQVEGRVNKLEVRLRIYRPQSTAIEHLNFSPPLTFIKRLIIFQIIPICFIVFIRFMFSFYLLLGPHR